MKNVIKMNNNAKIDKLKYPESPKKGKEYDKLILEYDHYSEINYLMNNANAALRLAIDNLVLTYGVEAVRKIINSTDLKLIKKSKKVA